MRVNTKPFPAYGKSTEWIDPVYEGMWRLPDLQTPPPIPTTFDPNILCVIPLFKDDYRRVENVEAFARMALYSRWSCYNYTEAFQQAIRIQFLVEECLAARVLPTFKQNFVDIDRDVLFFTADPLKESADGSWGHLGKQMVPYWDKRFAEYEWLFVWDADILFLPEASTIGKENNAPLSNKMFSKVYNLPKTPSYLYVRIVPAEIIESQLVHRLTTRIEKSGLSVDELLKMSDVSRQRQTILIPSCCLWVYPAKQYHENHQDFIKWMQRYAPYWGSDEIITGYWTQKFNLNVNSLHAKLNILANDMGYFFDFKPAGNILHGIIRMKFEKQLHEALQIL